jgi:eukaryotic-like serine/threonine-protein kinase
VPKLPAIPGFRTHARLGGGPLCDVVSATDATGRIVAVKRLKPEKESDPAAVALIRREARVGTAVRNRYLVPIDDANVLSAPYYLTMPLIAGESAKHRLREDGRLELPHALAVARQIAEALAALHSAGFIHGDVKSDNIRLSAPGRAVLMDLGFAHTPGELTTWAAAGFLMGTPNTIAPELLLSAPDDTFAADLFSFGVVVFELLTGELPYRPGTAKDVVKRRRTDGPAQLPGRWPAGLSEFVLACTNSDPLARPTAKQAIAKLTALQILSLRKVA